MDKAKIKCLIVYGQISPGNAIHFSEQKAAKRRSNHFVETPFWFTVY